MISTEPTFKFVWDTSPQGTWANSNNRSGTIRLGVHQILNARAGVPRQWRWSVTRVGYARTEAEAREYAETAAEIIAEREYDARGVYVYARLSELDP